MAQPKRVGDLEVHQDLPQIFRISGKRTLSETRASISFSC